MCKFAKSNAILEIQRAKWLKISPEVWICRDYLIYLDILFWNLFNSLTAWEL